MGGDLGRMPLVAEILTKISGSVDLGLAVVRRSASQVIYNIKSAITGIEQEHWIYTHRGMGSPSVGRWTDDCYNARGKLAKDDRGAYYETDAARLNPQPILTWHTADRKLQIKRWEKRISVCAADGQESLKFKRTNGGVYREFNLPNNLEESAELFADWCRGQNMNRMQYVQACQQIENIESNKLHRFSIVCNADTFPEVNPNDLSGNVQGASAIPHAQNRNVDEDLLNQLNVLQNADYWKFKKTIIAACDKLNPEQRESFLNSLLNAPNEARGTSL